MTSWLEQRLGPPPQQQTVRYQPGQPWPPQPPQPLPPPQAPQQTIQQQQVEWSQVRVNDVAELVALHQMWKGTDEEKQHTDVCPKCGGPLQMFTQLGVPKIMNKDGVTCRPMERCHYCGYNGHFEQLGQQLTDQPANVRVID